MSDRTLTDCPLCKHPEADLEHYRNEHPLPHGPARKGTWKIDWEGQPYITYVKGQ